MTSRQTLGDRIVQRCRDLGNAICLGLDPRPTLLPEEIVQQCRDEAFDPADELAVHAEASARFCEAVLERIGHRVAAIKPQAAFFEVFLDSGFSAFERVCRRAAATGAIVIGDVKRGDIGSTAAAYASAYLTERRGRPLVDAVTVNPYLGSDGVLPFRDAGLESGRGAFLLVKTSNPSSGDLQDRELDDGLTVCDHVADLVRSWNTPIGASGYGPLGAVVGLTWPEHIVRLRERLAGVTLLVPGYGAQGAGADDVQAAFDGDGQGALISASRSLTFPWAKDGSAPTDWRDRITAALEEMIEALDRARSRGS